MQRQAQQVNLQRSAVAASGQALKERGLQAVPAVMLQRQQPALDRAQMPLLPAERQTLQRKAESEITVALSRDAHYLPPRARAEAAAQTIQRYAKQGLEAEPLRDLMLQRATDVKPPEPALTESARDVLRLQRKEEQARTQAAQDHGLLLEHAALQRKLHEATAQHDAAQHQSVATRIQERQGGGEALAPAVKRHLEMGLNADLSQVRIHHDSEADKLAKSVNALAFTSGQDIYFQTGKYDPGSPEGMELLAHEATHTVQQASGKVGPGIDPDSSLEAEAQQRGAQLAARPMPAAGSAAHSSEASTSGGSTAETARQKRAGEYPSTPIPVQEKAPRNTLQNRATTIHTANATGQALSKLETKRENKEPALLAALPRITAPTSSTPASTVAIQRKAASGDRDSPLTLEQGRANARSVAAAATAAARSASARLTSQANSAASSILSASQAQQQAVQQAGKTQASKIRSAAQQSQQAVKQHATKAHSAIQSKAQAGQAKLNAQHSAQAAKAAQTVQKHQTKVDKTAQKHTTKATETGNKHAQKAQAKTQTALSNVQSNAAGKGGLAPEVTQAKTDAGQKIASESSAKIGPAGQQISVAATNTGVKAATAFQKYGAQVVQQIGAAGPQAKQHLTATKQTAQRTVTQTSQKATTQISTTAAKANAKIASGAAKAQTKVTHSSTQTAKQLKNSGQAAANKIKQHAVATNAATNAAAAKVRAKLANAALTNAQASALKSRATQQLQGAGTNAASKARSTATKASSGIKAHGNSIKSKLNATGPQAATQLKQASGKVGTQLSRSASKVTPAFSQIAQHHQQSSQKLVSTLGSGLTQTSTKAQSKFEAGQTQLSTTLQDKIGQDSNKLMQASQTAVRDTATVQGQIDSKAQSEKSRIEAEAKAKENAAKKDESWWDKATSFLKSIGDWLSSQLQDAWDMISSPGFWVGLVVGIAVAVAVAAALVAIVGTGGAALPLLVTLGIGLAAGAAGGAAAGAAGTMAQNAYEHKPLMENVGKNALIGAGLGAAGGLILAGGEVIGLGIVGTVALGSATSAGLGIINNLITGQPWDKNLLANTGLGFLLTLGGKYLQGRSRGKPTTEEQPASQTPKPPTEEKAPTGKAPAEETNGKATVRPPKETSAKKPTFEELYKDVLDDPNYQQYAKELNRIKQIKDPELQAKAMDKLKAKVATSQNTGLSPRAADALRSLENLKTDPIGDANSQPNHNHYAAARKEAQGVVVARKADGRPFSHISELQQASDALKNVIRALQDEQQHPMPKTNDRGLQLIIDKLSEAQRMQNRLKGFLNQIGQGKFPPYHSFPPGS